jgi:hypothetical protein
VLQEEGVVCEGGEHLEGRSSGRVAVAVWTRRC